MKKLIIAAAAVLFATSAYATDVVKKKTPLPPFKPLQTTSISVSGGFVENSDNVNYNLDIEHYVHGSVSGGFFVGGQVGRDERDGVSNNAEASVGAKIPLTPYVSAKGSAGVGQQWVPGDDFAYYVARLGIDARLTSNWTWNVAEYRYRNSFSSGKDYEQHRIGTGVTYNFNEKHSVFGKVYHDFNTGLGNEDNGVLFGYKFTF